MSWVLEKLSLKKFPFNKPSETNGAIATPKIAETTLAIITDFSLNPIERLFSLLDKKNPSITITIRFKTVRWAILAPSITGNPLSKTIIQVLVLLQYITF